MKDIISVAQFNDIPAPLQNTAVGRLLAYHNLGHAFHHHDRPELLIVTCMDYRVGLQTPERFAFVIRIAERGFDSETSTSLSQSVSEASRRSQ